mgnify:CR=1 FL=1
MRSQIQNAVLRESSVSTQRKRDLDLFKASKRKEDISLLQESKMPMPWASINKEEMKIVQKINSSLQTREFGRHSIKTWRDKFQEIFDKNFITDRIGKISILYTTCSKPIKDQLASMGVAEEMKEDSYTWIHLLQTVCLLKNSPNHTELALKKTYAGMEQRSTETLSTYLERV